MRSLRAGKRIVTPCARPLRPYGTLINDPKLSKTGGKWTCATVPGHTDKAQSRSWVDGHFLGITKYAQHRDWSLQFIQMACSPQFMRRSMLRGNAPPRGSVLRDPQFVEQIGWPPVAAAAIETGFPSPAHPVFATLTLSLRAGLSQCILGRRRRSRRWMMSRPIGSADCGGRATGQGSRLPPWLRRRRNHPDQELFLRRHVTVDNVAELEPIAGRRLDSGLHNGGRTMH